jgi:hypothetical protein
VRALCAIAERDSAANHAQEPDRSKNRLDRAKLISFSQLVPGHVSAPEGRLKMAKRFKIGDHVKWNSEAGRVSGTIIAIHTHDFDYKGRVRHASPHDPQYEIKSDKTDHIAAHKGSALDHA